MEVILSTPNFETFDIAGFAKEIRAFTEKHGISMRRFVKMVGMSPENIRRFESGDYNITVDLAAKIQKTMRKFRDAASRQAERPAKTS